MCVRVSSSPDQIFIFAYKRCMQTMRKFAPIENPVIHYIRIYVATWLASCWFQNICPYPIGPVVGDGSNGHVVPPSIAEQEEDLGPIHTSQMTGTGNQEYRASDKVFLTLRKQRKEAKTMY